LNWWSHVQIDLGSGSPRDLRQHPAPPSWHPARPIVVLGDRDRPNDSAQVVGNLDAIDVRRQLIGADRHEGCGADNGWRCDPGSARADKEAPAIKVEHYSLPNKVGFLGSFSQCITGTC